MLGFPAVGASGSAPASRFPVAASSHIIDFGNTRASDSFIDEEELVYSISAKTGGKAVAKQQRAVSLAIGDGKAWKTCGTTAASGLTFSLGGEMPSIGDKHPFLIKNTKHRSRPKPLKATIR